jgi:fucose permease
MGEEIAVYQDENIHVTNLRAMLQGKTYAMANVTSVSMFRQAGNTAPGVVAAVIGGFMLLGAAADSELRGCFLVFGLIILVIGIAILASTKDTYWVRIGSASGETNALSSTNRDYIQRVVNAMNEAIVRRG